MSELGNLIKNAREKKGLSQRELSRQTGIDNNTIAKIENGTRKKPNVLSLKKLALTLHISLKELLILAGYSQEDIEIFDNQTLLAINNDNSPIMTLDEMIESHRIELLTQKVVNDIFDSYDVNKINFYQDINSSDKKKITKKFNNLKKENKKRINDLEKKILNLTNLLNNKKD